ncbi:MAG: hypothetical protein ACOYJ6_20665, partial [Caulobacterales bacterium]
MPLDDSHADPSIRPKGATWFEVADASLVPFRARGDGCNLEQSPFTIVNELAAGVPIDWVDGYERHQRVFRNAVGLDRDRHRYELGEAIAQISALYVYGLTLTEESMAAL